MRIHLVVSIGILAISAVAVCQDVSFKQEFLKIDAAGVGTAVSGPGIPPPAVVDRKLETRKVDLESLTHLNAIHGAAPAKPLTYPVAVNSAIAASNPGFFGFDGLNHADQRLAGTGIYANTQFSLEPPDQGFCVGNGYALETVNTALAVFRSDSGALVSGPTSLSQFFGLKPEIVRGSSPVFGDFISDPRCHYDAQTGRFFLTILRIAVNPATGDFLPESHLLIAVSQSGNPAGNWNRYRLTTTTHGTAGACPCFGDQPLIGFDSNGLYISTNSFSILGSGYAGVQIYAISKLFLAAGTVPPFVLHIALSDGLNADGSFEFSVHPSIDTRGQEGAHLGKEYFLSTYSIIQDVEDKISVWVLENTALLNVPPGPSTTFRLRKKVISSEVYGVPPDALQKRGTLPLGSQFDPKVFEMLATNDHRMQAVTFANDRLWSAVTTGLNSPGETALKAGVAWFAVDVQTDENNFLPAIKNQGYIAMANGNVFFPAVGVNSSDSVAIGFSASSPDMFPSTGYVMLASGKPGKIHIAGKGANSEDGFTGYPALAPTGCYDLGGGNLLCEARWGDYGAAAVDADGTIWMANEYIGPRPRTLLANWGTFITRVKPSDNNNGEN